MDTIAQAASAFSLESVLQFTGVGGFATVLLWATLTKAKEQDRAFRSLSITLVTLQQSLLIYSMSHKKSGDETNVDECRRLLSACAELHRVLDQQRVDLEKQFTK